jgi:hypothetical protein
MIATWYGGPNDGGVIEVKDATYYLAVIEQVQATFVDFDEPLDLAPTKIVNVPIKHKYIVLAEAENGWPPCVVGWKVLDWTDRSER